MKKIFIKKEDLPSGGPFTNGDFILELRKKVEEICGYPTVLVKQEFEKTGVRIWIEQNS